jgi:hypothetical protein
VSGFRFRHPISRPRIAPQPPQEAPTAPESKKGGKPKAAKAPKPAAKVKVPKCKKAAAGKPREGTHKAEIIADASAQGRGYTGPNHGGDGLAKAHRTRVHLHFGLQGPDEGHQHASRERRRTRVRSVGIGPRARWEPPGRTRPWAAFFRLSVTLPSSRHFAVSAQFPRVMPPVSGWWKCANSRSLAHCATPVAAAVAESQSTITPFRQESAAHVGIAPETIRKSGERSSTSSTR